MSDADAPTAEVTIGLDADQALVLLDLLSRWSDNAGGGETPSATCFESPAELAVPNALCCLLERQPVTPFSPNHAELLAAARDRLAPGWSYPTLKSQRSISVE